MNLTDIEYTDQWSDEDWRETLVAWTNYELLDAYAKVGAYNPACWESSERNAKSLETYRHARHCIEGAILERMVIK